MARRTREESLETREKLLESALRVMTEKPFSKVTMREIAERIGLSKGAAYWHFKNKEEILVQLIQVICKELEGESEFAEGGNDALAKIRNYYMIQVTKGTQSQRLEKINILFQRKLEWPKEVHEKVYLILRDRIHNEQRLVEKAIYEGQEKNQVRRDVSPREIASLISATFLGLFILFGPNPLYPRREIDPVKSTDFIFDAFAAELAVKPRKQTSRQAE